MFGISMGRRLMSYYLMKLKEHREEIDSLKAQVTLLSNLLWEMKQELDKKSRWNKPYGDYRDYGDFK